MLKYYEKDNIQLFLGDCVKILEKATPESVDMTRLICSQMEE